VASKIYETQFLLGARVQGSFGKSFDTVNRRLRGTQSALAGLGSQLKSMIGFAIVAQQIGAAVTKSHEFKKQMDDVATLLDGKVGPKIKTMGLQVQIKYGNNNWWFIRNNFRVRRKRGFCR